MRTNLPTAGGCSLRFLLASICVAAAGLFSLSAANAQSPQQQAREILEAAGVQGGLVVHLGCGNGKLTAALRAGERFMVHGLDRTAANVEQAREHVKSQGVYGKVSVDRLAGERLPYIDNLVNLLVAEDLGGISKTEALRVLAPSGVAYVKQDGAWTRTVKPRPANIDEWTHFLHDATGNAVAHDDVVGPPRHLQWIGSPRWSRHHDRMASMSALVSSGGRVFYIMDEGSRVSIQLPPKWTLIARDAFNGVVLWKQPIEKWHSHLWPLKSGPTQLARRLVATGDKVYVTLGIDAPLTALDAATGEILHTFEDSAATEEVIVSEGTVFALVNKGKSETADYIPLNNVGDQSRVAREFHWNQEPRRIMAFDADSGKNLWTKESRVAPISLAADGQRVFFHDGEKVVCLGHKGGDDVWSSPPVARRAAITMNFGPRVVLYKHVVLYAGGDRTMRAYEAASGKELWQAPHDRGGYSSPEDLLIAGGLVWSAPTTSGRDSGVYSGRDPFTGELKQQFAPNVETYWFHHRCHMAKATDKFLLPSRTGIEFVDTQKEDWNINHWVRGGCLYGVMPCNGLVYAPPHDCACYAEAKLFGLNALAPAAPQRQLPGNISDEDRLQRGPAYSAEIPQSTLSTSALDNWPTYRHDAARSGFTDTRVPTDLKNKWKSKLGGKLSSVVVAGGKLLTAQVDTHTVFALDAASGETSWSYTAGGRVDSPPTIWQGRALFGAADGFVYCLRLDDGALVWRFRAAPEDRRLMSLEQLESVWPVNGSVLVEEGAAYFVAGRSNFLDGGLRWLKLDAKSGEKLAEVVLDENDPILGGNLQQHVQILQMPVGLPDVLSSDGQHVYMRSQKFDKQGVRIGVAPHSGQAAEQGATQQDESPHLFAPMGFLDDTWFHRSYWVFGRSYAGGHNGYYQAGKYAPSGRILSFDGENVYGFGRKPQYLRWTTILEHQLFSAVKEAPHIERIPRRGGSMIRVDKSKSIDPTGTPLTVEAWAKTERPGGVVVARGGPARGYALIVRQGKPRFTVRIDSKIYSVGAQENIRDRWVHLAGVLGADKTIKLYVDGKPAGSAKVPGFITADPAQALEIGADDGGSVGSYNAPNLFTGAIDEVRLYHSALSEDAIQARFANNAPAGDDAKLVLSLSFDDGQAQDASGAGNQGRVQGARAIAGKLGGGMRFEGGGGNRSGGSNVKPHWTQDIPLLARAMVLAGDTLFVAGPADVVDEEQSFGRLMKRDNSIEQQLAEQDEILEGKQGALLLAVSAKSGKTLAQHRLDSLPVWDSMAAVGGELYLTTTDGSVVCLEGRE